VAGCCEHDTEVSGTIKYRKFPDQLSECHRLRKDSTSFVYLVDGVLISP
jgi:hypothetical protein